MRPRDKPTELEILRVNEKSENPLLSNGISSVFFNRNQPGISQV